MSKYKDIFTDFARALDNERHAIECLSDTTKNNFSIYRNNIQINRINALRIAYPSIDSLLGTEFFDAMSLIYVQQSPASHANLHEEGADFPQFIAHFPPCYRLLLPCRCRPTRLGDSLCALRPRCGRTWTRAYCPIRESARNTKV